MSKRVLDVRSCVFHSACEAQRRQARELMSKGDFLFVERSFDDTPAHLSFGNMSEMLRPHVRYIVPRAHRGLVGKAMASHSELCRFNLPRVQHGSMDIMSQNLIVQNGC
eukprot:7787567-Pyramimonas_sp.AAC.1